MTDQGGQGVVAASDATSRLLEELQFTLGEGPCRDAYDTGRPVLVPDLSGGTGATGPHQRAAHRWPGYAPAVHGRGVRAVFAFPLQVGAGRLGVLDVYRDSVGPLSRQALAQALLFADVAVTILLDGQASGDAAAEGDGADETVDDLVVVHQAQGMVMIQLGVPVAEALARLRADAYSTDRRLSEVARDVVARRLAFAAEHRDG